MFSVKTRVLHRDSVTLCFVNCVAVEHTDEYCGTVMWQHRGINPLKPLIMCSCRADTAAQ